jgi:hypothetical protein
MLAEEPYKIPGFIGRSREAGFIGLLSLFSLSPSHLGSQVLVKVSQSLDIFLYLT